MSKDTLQLPKTAFSMKASLPSKEPEIIKKAWAEHKENVGDHEYAALLGDRKPPLDYRK